jgi:hypothetical protein
VTLDDDPPDSTCVRCIEDAVGLGIAREPAVDLAVGTVGCVEVSYDCVVGV